MSLTPQNYDPAFRIKPIIARVWKTTGNTDVVVDANVSSNSIIEIMNTSAYTGPWYLTLTPGTGFTVTSGNSETATTTTYSYIIL